MRVNLKLLSDGRLTGVACLCIWLKPTIFNVFCCIPNSEVRLSFPQVYSCCPAGGQIQGCVSHAV